MVSLRFPALSSTARATMLSAERLLHIGVGLTHIDVAVVRYRSGRSFQAPHHHQCPIDAERMVTDQNGEVSIRQDAVDGHVWLQRPLLVFHYTLTGQLLRERRA